MTRFILGFLAALAVVALTTHSEPDFELVECDNPEAKNLNELVRIHQQTSGRRP